MENKRDERGQVLVIVAVAFVVLLLFAGLAIDGGSLHFGRRRMQNAADAGALAGARVLSDAMCDEPGAEPTDADVYSAVWEYARRNGVTSESNMEAAYVQFDTNNSVTEFNPSVFVGNGTIPEGASGVIVTTTVTQTTFFMGMIGFDETDAVADATAVTGPPLIAGGMRPFGLPLEVMMTAVPGESCFTTSFKNCGGDADDPCYIVDDDGNEVGQHRAWMNFNHIWNQNEESDGWPRATGGSGNASDLAAWMESGWDGTLYADCYWSIGCRTGDYIHGKPGTNSSVIGHVPVGESFFIPIYDITPHYDDIPAPKAPSNSAGDFYYHIVGFGGVVVPSESDYNQGGGTIRVCVEEIIWGEGQPSPNTGYGTDVCETHTMIVTLWE